MENIFVAIVVVFLLLFGALTMSNANLTAQQTLVAAQQEREARANDIARTTVSPVDIQIMDFGNVIKVTLCNDGSLKLADFDQWDVFTEYYDSSATPVYHTQKLSYDATSIVSNAWSVEGIYRHWAQNTPEDYEPGVLNPGEALVLLLNVSPGIGVGQSTTVTIVTENGVPESIIGTRNVPPVQTLNTGLKVALHGTTTLTNEMLLTQDSDNEPQELIYTLTIAPAGTLILSTTSSVTLSLGSQFTQQDINDGALVYTHSGETSDSFAFTVSDGVDSIGPFTTTISVNAALVLTTNLGLMLPTGATATITNALLDVTDADDLKGHLIYTVTQFPANGILSLGTTFSQEAIDQNRLTYIHTGTSADLFKFVISDGYDVIGEYSFVIVLLSAP